MVTTSRERRVDYDVGEDFTLPDLFGVSPALNRIAERDTVELHSSYYDTKDLLLFEQGITLRRRAGTIDRGWQLKWSDGKEQIKVASAQDGRVPGQLRNVVFGARRRRPLRKVMTLSISRDTRRLLTSAGHVLATVSYDVVQAASPGAPQHKHTWREVEVKLGPAGNRALQRAITARLTHNGAVPSARRSALARAVALLETAPESARVGERITGSKARSRTAGDVIRAYICQQNRVLLLGDVMQRAGLDAVHDTRVAVRRLRSTLRVCQGMFDTERASQLDAELAWYGQLLGAVRDREILHAHLQEAIAALPSTIAEESFGTRVDELINEEQQQCTAQLQRAMRSGRYVDLLDDLASWAVTAPMTASADAADTTLRRYVRTAERVALRRRQQISRTTTDEGIHRVRKAAKRARYSAELAKPVLGKKQASKKINRYGSLQDSLGDAQDALVCARFIRESRGSIGDEFAGGVLYDRELRRAHSARTKMGL